MQSAFHFTTKLQNVGSDGDPSYVEECNYKLPAENRTSGHSGDTGRVVGVGVLIAKCTEAEFQE